MGWAKLLRARPEVAGLADLAEENPLIRAADRYITIRKFVPTLLEALTFKAARDNDPLLAAVTLLRALNQSGKRDVPSDAPMPFRKEWRRLVVESGTPNRRLYEMAVLATLRNKLRSGDVWVERSSSYRRFDSYLLPTATVPPVVSELGLPDTADAWLAVRGQELDERLKRFARRLRRNQLDGVELRDERLHITPVKAATPAEATALAARLDALLPRVRITARSIALTVALSMPAGTRTTASPICTSMAGSSFGAAGGGVVSSTTGANTNSSSWKRLAARASRRQPNTCWERNP